MTTSKRPPMTVKREAVATVQPAVVETSLAPYTPPPGVKPAGAGLAMDDATQIYQWATTQYAGYGVTQTFVGFPVLSDLTQRPEYRVITETIARDATRKWCKLVAKGDDQTKADKLTELQEAVDAYGVQDLFRKCCELDGFFGRGHLYIDTGASDDPDELAKPMPVDKRKIGKGKLVRLATVEPVWTYPNDYNSADPLKPNYYRPQSWFVMGKIVHRDRLITFVSREVPDLLKPSYAFGGISMSQLAMPYVDNWIRTRQSVSDLLHSFSKTILKTNMAGVLTGGGADALLSRLDLFNRTRDNRGVIAVDMTEEDIVDVSTPLSSLDKLQAQSQEQMASVAGIPLVVLLGITPSGLNASSDGEIAAYEARIASLQERLFDAPLTKVLQILQLHLWGEIDDAIVHEWLPIGEQDEGQQAATQKIKVDTVVAAVDGSLVSPEEGRAALAADPESLFHGIDLTGPPPEPPEDPEGPPGDDGEPPPSEGAEDAWNEGEHPRAENGEFGSGGGHTETSEHDEGKAQVAVTLKKIRPDNFEIESNGQRAGDVTINRHGDAFFIDRIELAPGFQGKRIGSTTYNALERGLNMMLVPSPLGLSESATALWQKRLAKMTPDDAREYLDRAWQIGKGFGLRDEHLLARLGPLRDGYAGPQ
jgi:uncharacterized protein